MIERGQHQHHSAFRYLYSFTEITTTRLTGIISCAFMAAKILPTHHLHPHGNEILREICSVS